MTDRNSATVEDLPYEIKTFGKKLSNSELTDSKDKYSNSSLPKTVIELERGRIIEALRKCGWVKSHAAKLLGITPRQLTYRMDKYRIDEKRPWE